MRFLFITMLFLSLFGLKSMAQDEILKPVTVGEGTFIGISKPLKDIPPLTEAEYASMVVEAERKLLNPKLRTRYYPYEATALPKGPDAAWQKLMGQNKSAASDPLVNFQGQNSPYFPPDENGTAGPDHYMQTVNTTYAIYSKTGTLLAGPTDMNELFGTVPGSSCNDGDPIILYDEMADRWMAAEFSLCQNPDRMLVAISATNDPTGTWYQYSFNMNGMPDYEKFGIWPDGYYMGTNTSSGTDIYVFEREVMLAGGTNPKMVSFDNQWRPGSVDGFMMVPPVDNDGPAAPAGSPGIFIAQQDDAFSGSSDQLWIYELDVDWTTTTNSTFTRVQQIDVTPYDSNFGNNWNNIKQPNTSQELDGVPQVIMNVPQYRNFGSYQTIVCCHTVDVDATDHAGIRWYELRKTTGEWTVRQTGTYAPDEHSRWMGSVMLNGSNEIGLGYSISSTTVFPGIRYTGQTEEEYNNANGVMDVPEGIILEGTSSQTGANRWGDYSLLCVDPADDETFWYTNQYVSGGQKTKIASFSIGPLGPNPNFVADNTLPCLNETVSFIDLSTGNPTAWSWSFTPNTVEYLNGTSSNSQNPIVQFVQYGNYSVTLNATNAGGTIAETKVAYIGVNIANAQFSATPVSIVVNNPTTFSDESTCDVTSWAWDFGADAVPPTATTPGPHNVVYTTTGAKTISLTVNGDYTTTKTDYINVIPDVFVMNSTSVTSCTGTFFDPGGEAGNYGNNLNYTMVFSTSIPGNQISVNFSDFNLETSDNCSYDYLRIHNGRTPFAPVLGTWCGTDSPGTVTSDNATGSLTFVFHSNSSVNSPGWAATVNCISPVSNPVSLSANAITDVQINLGWEKNQEGNPVLLAVSPDGTFGIPMSGQTYNNGDNISGGGSVIFTGNETSYSHTGLNPVTTYYYKAFSYDSELNYSQGITAQATTPAAPPTLAVSPLNQDVNSAGGSTTFEVNSNSDWTALSDAAWCTVTPAGSGIGNISANFTVNEMAMERVANIMVTVGGLDPITVTVTQAGASPELLVDPTNSEVANTAGNLDLNVTSNANWTVLTEADWLTVTPSGTGNGTISIDYQENTWAAIRTALFSVTVDGLDPVEVSLTQAAAVAHLNIDPQLIQVSAEAGIAQLMISANTDWLTGSDAGWVSMPAGAGGNAIIQITYEQNPALIARNASVTITAGGLSQTAVLEQAGAEATVSVNPGNVNVTYTAGNINFDITSNTTWTASADSAWLTVTPEGNLSGTLVATYLQNPYYAERISTISVVVAGKEPQKVTVTQSGSEVSVEENELRGIRIFPNPSEGLFVLEVDKASYPSIEVQVSDLAGHAIVTRTCSGEDRYVFDLTGFTQGTYTMRIKTENKIMTRKIVIIR
ncbi:MAG: T9SS type A sorting domain-containing protein [Bacteroidales bacterium]|nr:T9SS type A sorting domain-containing protein [Bacteroidales bacterium]